MKIIVLLLLATAYAWEDNYDNDECSFRFNNNHCGKYGEKCREGKFCMDSICECPYGLTSCSDICVDTKCDNDHCGDCDNKCKDGANCIKGICTCPNNHDACGTPDPISGICPVCTGPTPSCCDGACTCPNTFAQCTSGTESGFACTTCRAGQQCELSDGIYKCVCGGGDTSCPTGGPSTCTDCGLLTCFGDSSGHLCGCCTTSSGSLNCIQCTAGYTHCRESDPGSCCIETGLPCNLNGDCCTNKCQVGFFGEYYCYP